MLEKKLTVKEISQKYLAKQLTPLEVVQNALTKIDEQNKNLNIFVKIFKEDALQQAKESTKRLADGKPKSMLDGIPIAVKDNIAIEGRETTAASKILQGFVSPYNATVVEKLTQAGAIIVGQTNMDEFAMGSSTESSFYGPTKNPQDVTRVPGGSSGGSAAAVSAGMVPLALGSDTGGSIRQPASLCGIVGFKPTYGAVSRYGLFAMASSLDQIGPMALNTEDTEVLYNIISGYDSKDATSIEINQKSKIKNQNDISKCKIGVPKEYFAEGLSPEVKKVIEKAIGDLEKAGARIKEVSLPNSKYALSCYYLVMPVEVASNLARYDGVKYGFSAQAPNLEDVYLQTRSEGFGQEAKRRIMLGTYASSAGYVDKYYNQAQRVRNIIKNDFARVFEEVDLILGPVYPEAAFKFGQKSDPLTMYLSDIYTVAVNLAGLPAISVPCGFIQPDQNYTPGVGAKGLPVGLQIIGRPKEDDQIFEIAKFYEGVRDGLSGE